MTFAQVFTIRLMLNMAWVGVILAIVTNFPNGDFVPWDFTMPGINITEQTGVAP